ncbi:hypothetical protein D3C81_1791400 [compost metagenome]
MTIDRADGLVQAQQTAAAEYRLGADMADLAFDVLAKLRFTGIAHWQVDVPAFSGQRHPTALAEVQQRADAKAGTGANDHCGVRGVCRARTHCSVLAFLQTSHAQGHGGKVIDQQ